MFNAITIIFHEEKLKLFEIGEQMVRSWFKPHLSSKLFISILVKKKKYTHTHTHTPIPMERAEDFEAIIDVCVV